MKWGSDINNLGHNRLPGLLPLPRWRTYHEGRGGHLAGLQHVPRDACDGREGSEDPERPRDGEVAPGLLALKPVTDPPHGFVQVLERVGVAEAEIAFAVLAECRPAEARDAGLLQQAIRQFFRARGPCPVMLGNA